MTNLRAAWWGKFKQLAARVPVVKLPEPKPAPKAKRRDPSQHRKGTSPRCQSGHLYTPETTGTRVVAGVEVRKCLVCEAERKARPPRKPRCGTIYAYRLHRQRGEDCAKCRAVNAKLRARQRAAKKEKTNGTF